MKLLVVDKTFHLVENLFWFVETCVPPVRAKPVFTFNDTETMEIFISMDLSRKFRLTELDQVMHQNDEMFVYGK